MRLRSRNARRRRDPGQKGATIALFNWSLSKVIILSTAAWISPLPRSRGQAGIVECECEEGLGCRCTLRWCGQHYSPRALSAPPLIAVFVAAPTISLPFSYTSTTLRYLVSRSSTSVFTRCLRSQLLAVSTFACLSLSVLFIYCISHCRPQSHCHLAFSLSDNLTIKVWLNRPVCEHARAKITLQVYFLMNTEMLLYY